MWDGFAGLWFSSILQLIAKVKINPEAAREAFEVMKDETSTEVTQWSQRGSVSFFKPPLHVHHILVFLFSDFFYPCECLWTPSLPFQWLWYTSTLFLSYSENHSPHSPSACKEQREFIQVAKCTFSLPLPQNFSQTTYLGESQELLFAFSDYLTDCCCVVLLCFPGCSFPELFLFQAFWVVEEKKKTTKQNNFFLWAKHKLGNWADRNAHWSRGEWICNLNYCGIKAPSSLCSLI